MKRDELEARVKALFEPEGTPQREAEVQPHQILIRAEFWERYQDDYEKQGWVCVGRHATSFQYILERKT